MFYLCLLMAFLFYPNLSKFLYLQSNNTNKNKTNNKLGESIQQQTNNKYISASRNLRDIYSRSGLGLDILCVVFAVVYVFVFSKRFCFFLLCLMFSPNIFKFLLEHDTIHYTRHQQI